MENLGLKSRSSQNKIFTGWQNGDDRIDFEDSQYKLCNLNK